MGTFRSGREQQLYSFEVLVNRHNDMQMITMMAMISDESGNTLVTTM